jgi:GH25 family lysozyme M1 (1,4-beta-N-acetylmuramidase)
MEENKMTETAQGIDVSRAQPPLTPTDLNGFAFAFAKATDGPELTDPDFAGNWSVIKQAEIYRGAYHELWSPESSPAGAQAAHFLDVVRSGGLEPGDMLAVVASDYSGVTGGEVLAFCEAVQAGAGPQCPVLVYSDLSVLPSLGQCTGYPLWVTWPSGTAPASVEPWSTWTLWQWGTVSNTDQDAFNGTAADMDAWIKTYTEPAEVSLSATMPVLQAGDADYAGASFPVHRLQALIAVIGRINNLAAASAVSADGNFGPETQTGLKAVQQYYKIAASGIADKDTWDALVAGTP